MYGHGRVPPPGHRTVEHAKPASRLLLVKAARRMRRFVEGMNRGQSTLFSECVEDWIDEDIRRAGDLQTTPKTTSKMKLIGEQYYNLRAYASNARVS